jgi:glycosyltransferase involved in cell wall biosynthesis
MKKFNKSLISAAMSDTNYKIFGCVIPKFVIAYYWSGGFKNIQEVDLEDEEGLINFVFSFIQNFKREIFFQEGLNKTLYLMFIKKLHSFQDKKKETIAKLEEFQLTPLLKLILFLRSDLRKILNSNIDIYKWWVKYGADEYNLIKFPYVTFRINFTTNPIFLFETVCDVSEFSETITNFEAEELLASYEYNLDAPYQIHSGFEKKAENNFLILGHFNSVNGIGEDARLIARAIGNCDTLDININGTNSLEFQTIRKVNLVKYKKIIFCMPIFDLYTLFFRHGGFFNYLEKSYLISQWELDSISDDLDFLPKQFYKFFSISKFSCQTFKKWNCIPQPIPLPLDPLKITITRRRPVLNRKVIFLFSFDPNSFVNRKNPYAVIKAFKLAFYKRQSDVQLIIKINSETIHSKELRDIFSRLTFSDPRILIINNILSPNEYRKVIDSADVFISLHRAEGFGRIIAEAAALGKFVVSSDYGGPKDYLSKKYDFLVKGTLIPITKDEYFLSTPSKWFNPNINSAVKQIKRSYEKARILGAYNCKNSKKRFRKYSLQNTTSFFKENF